MKHLLLALLLLAQPVLALTPAQKAELIEKVRQSKHEKRLLLKERIERLKQAKSLRRPHLHNQRKIQKLRQYERTQRNLSTLRSR